MLNVCWPTVTHIGAASVVITGDDYHTRVCADVGAYVGVQLVHIACRMLAVVKSAGVMCAHIVARGVRVAHGRF